MHSVAFFKEQIVCSAMQVISGGFIGVGASKFWGCKNFLSKFPQTCLKNFRAANFPKNNEDSCFGVFCVAFRKSVFWGGPKWVSGVCHQPVSFETQIVIWCQNVCARIFQEFVQTFERNCFDFWQIIILWGYYVWTHSSYTTALVYSRSCGT